LVVVVTALPCAAFDKVAYWDDRYPTHWIPLDQTITVRDAAEAAGFTIVNADELKTWMDARIDDKRLSVVIICKDCFPDTVAESQNESCTARRYLDAGGKIVFFGDIPFYNYGNPDGSETNWGDAGGTNILGFNTSSAPRDSNNNVAITEAGTEWGLTESWQSVRPLAPGVTDNVTILATDNAGNAGAWVKHYLPDDTFRGFVRIWDRGSIANTQDLINVALYGNLPGPARVPNPEDGSEDVDPKTLLRWEPGEYADKHDIYFGTTYEDVNNATTADAAYKGRQAENTYNPGELVLGQTYFWRVDEVNAPPDNTIYRGDTWQFAVEPVSFAIPIGAVTATASSMDGQQDPGNTVNGSGLNANDEHSVLLDDMWSAAATDPTPWIQFEFAQVQKLDKVQVWNHNTQTEMVLGFGIKEAQIEASVDGENWVDLGTVELPQANALPTYTGFEMALEGTVAKFIKVTALSNHSILGLPQKGLSEVRFYAVPMRARLEIPASGTAGLDPLVDLSWRAGRDASQHEVLVGTDPDALAPVATVDDPAYTASVDLDSTVYWQVNEINNAMDPAVWEGDIWTLNTAEYITVDDMESYKSKEGSYVWETWVDGFGDDNNGALLGHGGDDMETGITYDGGQSLPFYYGQGGAAGSEAFRDIDRDWGEHGIVCLSLMFYGAASNVPGPMYLKVNDQKIATYPTSSDLTLPQWQAWTLDLPAAALGNVNTLAIGFESGSGLVLIDAIRLYAKASERVTPVLPDDTGLMAFYTFEGNANDLSGNGNNGTLEGGPQYVAGRIGQALDFDGIDDFVSTGKAASQLGIDGNKPRTVSAWVYTRGYANGGIFDVGARNTGEDFCLRTLDDVVNRWRIQYWGGDYDFTFNTLERWVNFTHVHDGTHTIIYGDGRMLVNWEKTINTTDTNPFQIGRYGWPDAYFYGVIDEVRVYNRALTQAEALGLAERTEPIFKEF
jgi:hypothetical protein